MKVRLSIVLLCTNLILIMLFNYCGSPLKPDFPPRLGNDGNIKIEGTPKLGEKIIMYIIAQSDNPLTYKWYKSNAVIEGAENDSLVIDPLMIGHEGEYKCIATAASASATSNPYILNIIRENYDTLIDNNGIIFCSGKPQLNKQFFIYIKPKNNLAIDCQWYKNNEKILGETNDTLRFKALSDFDQGNYFCKAKYYNRTELSLSYALEFDSIIFTSTLPKTDTNPPNIVNIIGDTILIENSDQQFTVKAYGDSLTYQWQKDGRDIVNATKQNFSLSNVQFSDSGAYTCIVRNSRGSDSSSIIRVHVVLPVASSATHLGYNTLILTEKGSLWGRGRNNAGQLGDGSLEDRNKFVQIITKGVTAVWTATTGAFSYVLKDDYTLWGFGDNEDKQMGIDREIVNVPMQIASNITQAAGGRYHTLILKQDGSVWVAGSGSWGQLGDGSGRDKSTFTQLISNGVKSIAAGYYTSLILKEDGSVWGCGRNTHGQLGIGKGLDSSSTLVKIISSGVKSIAVGFWHSIFLRDDGSLWMTGTFEYKYQEFMDTLYYPTKIVENGVTGFSSGKDHVIFRKNDGSFWVFGANRYGQFTTGRRPAYSIEPIHILKDWDVEQVIATGNNTAIINKEGALWMCGEYPGEKNGIIKIVDEPTRVIIP